MMERTQDLNLKLTIKEMLRHVKKGDAMTVILKMSNAKKKNNNMRITKLLTSNAN